MPGIWSFPTRIRFGAGELAALGHELRALGAARALVVADQGVVDAGLVATVTATLTRASIPVTQYAGVHSNPLESDAAEGAAAFREGGCDVIVGVGGGSALDTAKLVGVRLRSERPFAELDDALDGSLYIPSDIPPVIAVPTTAGTGSEVGRAAVVTAAATGRKTVIFHPAMLPKLALLDPELTRGLPAHITAATGYDALTHCLEAFVARGDHPMADGIALRGLELVANSLWRAVAKGEDLSARGDMLKAAMMGAVAFQKGLGACHSMAHPLSSECGLHHGLANALCLPTVVRYNLQACPERYATVAKLFGADTAEELPSFLEQFREQLGLPSGLGGAGVSPEQITRLAELAELDGCHPQNPRDCSRDTFIELFRAAM